MSTPGMNTGNVTSIETEIDLDNPSKTVTVTPSSATTADDLQVEIVDDTPERDRGKARQEPLREAPKGVIPDEDELAQYSETVQKRIKKISFEYHEQRRAKEALERQNEEAARVLKQFYDENKRLRQVAKSGEQTLLENVKGRVETQIEATKDKLRKAHLEGDTEALIKAQEELNDLQNQRAQVATYQPQYQNAEPPPPPPRQQTPVVPPVDPKAQTWADKNTWFQKDTEMTATAFGLHQKLVQELGIDPRSEPDRYYAELDKGMRRRFPDHEWGDKPQESQPRRTVSSVVAPANRSAGASISPDGRKISLTASQVSLAKRLGLTPQQYAVELVKQARE